MQAKRDAMMPMPPSDDPFFDDTQPIKPRADDTQPVAAVMPPARRALLRWLLLPVGIILLALAGAALLRGNSDPREIDVVLVIAGQEQTITTEADTVAQLLVEQDISLDAGDVLWPGLISTLQPGLRIELSRARTVSLTVDGMTSILRTTAENPEEILRSAGLTLAAADRVVVDGTETSAAALITWPVPATNITIERAVTIEIVDGSQTRSVATTEDTVGEALFSAGVTLFLADTVTPDPGTPISAGLRIVVDRSRPVTIIADGSRIETRVSGQTVGAALTEAGVTLAGLDYVVPGEDEPVVPGMSLRVIRVTEDFITEEDILPFTTIYQADANLALDQRSVIQAGQTGLRRRVLRARYENGIEISRALETDEQVRDPVNQIIAYGTNIVVRTLETPGGPVQYWRRLRVYATSYHPAALGGDNITATGRVLTRGIVAIDPRIIPYFTNIYVEGYGVGLAADTGGPRSTPYWVDLGYDDDNYVGWSRWVDLYVLTPVPENVNYLLPENARGGPVP